MKFPIPGLSIHGAGFGFKPNQMIDIEMLDPDCVERAFEILEMGWAVTTQKENVNVAKPESPVTIIKTVEVSPENTETDENVKKILNHLLKLDQGKTTIYNNYQIEDNKNVSKLDETELKAREQYLESAQEEASSNISNFRTVEQDTDVNNKADELGDIDL